MNRQDPDPLQNTLIDIHRIFLLVSGLGNTFVRVIGDPYLRRKVIKMLRCKKRKTFETPAITESIIMETEGSLMLKNYENETVNLLYQNLPYQPNKDNRVLTEDLNMNINNTTLDQFSRNNLSHQNSAILKTSMIERKQSSMKKERDSTMDLKNLYGSICYHFSMIRNKSGLYVKNHVQQKIMIYITINKRAKDTFVHFQHLSIRNLSLHQKLDGSIQTPSSAQFQIKNQEFRFEEYRYKDFKLIRRESGILDQDLEDSFNSIRNEDIFKKELNKKQAGRSGKQIIFTYDRKFIIKEIDSEEKGYLIRIAQQYAEYIKENRDSLLARIYGLFSLKIENQSKVYFIIMHNLDIYPKDSVIFKYDLKFSEFNRRHLDFNELDYYRTKLIKIDDNFQDLIEKSCSQDNTEEDEKVEFQNSQQFAVSPPLENMKVRKGQTKEFPKSNTKKSFGKGLMQNSFSQNRIKLESYDLSNTMLSPQDSNNLGGHQLSYNFGSTLEEKKMFSNMATLIKKEKKNDAYMYKQLQLLKDIDYKNFHGQIQIHQSSHNTYQDFIVQVLQDTQFLSQQFIMDYSLLLMILKVEKIETQKILNEQRHNPFVFYTRNKKFAIVVGIIDYLQVFGIGKNIQEKAQKFWSALKNKQKKEISCVEPLTYFNRFNSGISKLFINTIIDEADENDECESN
ncbi:phosphatidylinositol phosphate kinase pipk5 [Stylonychia lemnae]|uniref:Phosphatidylinositol phosphate kinase pipk5 n=1 Tax=Stylonychia lemnae TaxID=5949 RepID=A0A078AH33_STYLE|nr:phosphatidylinositol phosphate kinase pipk5 [Stylonychia lemnae]|eukprot:CDW81549.1 phosphatidylinositol phosphate kinase pipk5 [Stylonychia lemnae]